jgi:hypothetical protein
MKLATSKKSRFISILITFLTGLLLMASWALASPPGGSPDEPTHFITIYCFSDSSNKTCLPPPPENVEPLPTEDESPCYIFKRGSGAGCEESNIFKKLDYASTSIFYLYSDNYYYRFMANFATETSIFSLIVMRIVNGIIFLLVFLLSVYLLPAHLRQAFAISTIVVSVPLGIYIISSINTSAWIIIGSIGTWSALYSMFTEFSKKNLLISKTILRIILFIISSFLIISSRTDGLYFLVIILFSMITFAILPKIKMILVKFFSNNTSNFILFIAPIFIAIISFYFFRNFASVTFVNNDFNFSDRIFENVYRLPHLLLGPLGTWGLGWLDIWLSPITYILMIVIFLGILFISINFLDLQHLMAIAIFVISAIALPLIILQTSGYLVGEWVQPRYILPLYYPILGLALLSYAGKQKFSSAQLFIIIFLTSIAHSFALFSNLERYLRGQNTFSYDLTVGLEWWWDQLPSPNTVWFLGSISFVIFFALLQQITKVKN